MKVSKNMLSVMAVAALFVTLSMPFAAEAKKGKHHGKKAHHAQAHKAKKAKKAKAEPAASTEMPAPAATEAAPAGQ
ncbi:MAG: hypothetical protein ACKOX6_09400 [Bdellovibrio sp.]